MYAYKIIIYSFIIIMGKKNKNKTNNQNPSQIITQIENIIQIANTS